MTDAALRNETWSVAGRAFSSRLIVGTGKYVDYAQNAAAAEAAGVRRYVMVSYLGASLHHDVPEDDPFYTYAQAKAEADEALRDSGLAWTILGPGSLTEEEPSGRITVDPDLSDSDASQREASRGNVARAIVAVLSEPGTVGRKIDFVDGDVPVAEAVRGD